MTGNRVCFVQPPDWANPNSSVPCLSEAIGQSLAAGLASRGWHVTVIGRPASNALNEMTFLSPFPTSWNYDEQGLFGSTYWYSAYYSAITQIPAGYVVGVPSLTLLSLVRLALPLRGVLWIRPSYLLEGVAATLARELQDTATSTTYIQTGDSVRSEDLDHCERLLMSLTESADRHD